MVIVQQESGWWVVTQSDHARLSADLMGLWRTDGLPNHPRREELLFAVREHDNGWRESDAAPRVDPRTGRPYDFRTLPAADRSELWNRGIERFAEDHPYAAALIARHRLELVRRWGARPEETPSVDRIRERLPELLAAGGRTEADLETDYPWLELADRLSLTMLGAEATPWPESPYDVTRSGETTRFSPFPLAGSTTFEVPARSVSARSYQGDSDFAVSLASARWRRLRLRLTA